MVNENAKYIRLFYILGYVFMLIGVVSGSLYYVNRCYGSEYINQYLEKTGIFLGDKVDYMSITIRALKSNLTMFMLIFCCMFFKIGSLIIMALIVKEGFVYGFTSSAFAAVYGIKGGVILSSMLPEIFAFVPAFILFSAVNSGYSVQKLQKEKNFFLRYLLFFTVVFTIFCVAAVFEGFLTTIFMKRAFSLVT